jgi:cystathionine beta-lyase
MSKSLTVDGLPLTELRHRTSTKWRDFDADVLPLPVAEMDFEIAQPIRNLLIGMLEKSDTGYLGDIPELNASFVAFAKSRWNWEVDSEQIFTCTDVGVGMVEMARTIVQPGDSIMVNSPVYHNMYNWINELKCTLHDAPLKRGGADNLHYTLDFDAIEAGYKAGVKIHFLCNPHNPAGTVFTRDELSQIADLAKKYGVAIFSDEIHAPLTYSDQTFVPFLNVSDAAREVGICVTAASKSWNLAGLKCAIIVTASEKEKARATNMPKAVHYRASLFGAFAAAKAYECTDWLDAALVTLDRNRRYVKELLTAHLPTVGYRIPDCSYLAWLDVSTLKLGEEPQQVFLDTGRVAFNAGATFSPANSTHNQFVRLNFGTSREILDEAVARMVATTK